VALLATPIPDRPMMLRDASIVARPPADPGSQPDLTTSQGEARSLVRAFATAQRAPARAERMADCSAIDAFPELTQAVREFVAARRADGSPPERVLATMKELTRGCSVVCIDESRADRLQLLLLREFLATYYEIPAPSPLPEVPE
jgi:hypothetical protein